LWKYSKCGVGRVAAQQHKSQFKQLIEAARRSRAGLKKPAVDVKDGVGDGDGEVIGDSASSTSSVELIADSEMLLSDAACPLTVVDDNHNQLLPGIKLLVHCVACQFALLIS